MASMKLLLQQLHTILRSSAFSDDEKIFKLSEMKVRFLRELELKRTASLSSHSVFDDKGLSRVCKFAEIQLPRLDERIGSAVNIKPIR